VSQAGGHNSFDSDRHRGPHATCADWGWYTAPEGVPAKPPQARLERSRPVEARFGPEPFPFPFPLDDGRCGDSNP